MGITFHQTLQIYLKIIETLFLMKKNRNKRRKGNNIDLVSLPTNCKKWVLIKKVNFFKFRAIVEERIQTDPLL